MSEPTRDEIEDQIAKAMDAAQTDRIKLAADAEKGVHELPTDEALEREHKAGLHDGDAPTDHPDCELCQEGE